MFLMGTYFVWYKLARLYISDIKNHLGHAHQHVYFHEEQAYLADKETPHHLFYHQKLKNFNPDLDLLHDTIPPSLPSMLASPCPDVLVLVALICDDS